MWKLGSLFPALVARVFEQIPDAAIWAWAEVWVWLDSKNAAEAGFYRSSKTPWTRRLQEIARHPYHNGIRVRKFVVKKSSQSGFSEAALNCIRWFSRYAPRNVIYAIDSREEAVNINDRLRPTLERLGEEIFTENDDDISKFILKLRHMIVWFFGSFSAGKFANKQAPFLVADEVEEHATLAGDTSTVTNLESRMKTSDEALFVLLSKPKLKGGPIDKEHRLGNQEVWEGPCPREGCGQFLELTEQTLTFKHCRSLLGEWDKRRVLSETYHQCPHCKQPIHEHEKAWMNDRARWRATAEATAEPGVISQQMSDFWSYNPEVSWGRIALKIIAAKGDRKARQGVRNHNLGLEWEDQVNKTEPTDIAKCRRPYKRGTVPFKPIALILGGDIGLDYAKWAVAAISDKNQCAVVDWGTELHPDGVLDVVMNEAWPEAAFPENKHMIAQAFMDAKYRKEDAYAACLRARGRMWPCSGGGTARSRQSFAFGQLPSYPQWFGLLSFNDRDAKSNLYIERIRQQTPEFWVPEDVDELFVSELCAERLEEDEKAPTAGMFDWKRHGANHWGDCVKLIGVGWRYLTRERGKPATQRGSEAPPTTT